MLGVAASTVAGRLRGRGQVEDQRPFGRGPQHFHHRLADLDREIELGGGEGLGAVFEMPVGVGLLRRLVAQQPWRRRPRSGGSRRGSSGTRPRATPARSRCRGGRSPAWRPSCSGSSSRSGRGATGVSTWIVTSPGMRPDRTRPEMKSNSVAPAAGKPTSISFTPHLAQQFEEARLLLAVHRIDQRLVAVAHVGGEPARRMRDGAARPLAVGQGRWRGRRGIWCSDRTTCAYLSARPAMRVRAG